MKKFLKRFISGVKRFIFGDDEPYSISIATPNGKMKFEVDVNNQEAFKKDLHLIREEIEVIFNDV